MTPEDVEKLRARQQSLEKTLAQIDEEIRKAPDAAGRDALELMRTNVRNNLAEVRDTLQAQNAPRPTTAQQQNGGDAKPPSDDHPPR